MLIKNNTAHAQIDYYISLIGNYLFCLSVVKSYFSKYFSAIVRPRFWTFSPSLKAVIWMKRSSSTCALRSSNKQRLAHAQKHQHPNWNLHDNQVDGDVGPLSSRNVFLSDVLKTLPRFVLFYFCTITFSVHFLHRTFSESLYPLIFDSQKCLTQKYLVTLLVQ